MSDLTWVKMFRSFREWGWYKDANASRVFLHLILSANFQDGFSKGVLVKRGQHLTSVKSLSNKLDIPEQQIRTALKRLKSTSEITIESTNHFSMITICNYSNYQSENFQTNEQTNEQTNDQLTSNQQATNEQLTTNKNVIKKEPNNFKNVNKEKTSKKENPLFPDKSENFNNAFQDYIEMRKQSKNKMTDKAIQLGKSKLEKLSKYEDIQIQMIEEAILNGWKSFYPLNQPKQQTNKKSNEIAELKFDANGDIIYD